MAFYVGRWDCSSCGTKGIKGPLTHCTQCGASRPADVYFYLPENPELVERQEEIEAASLGPDWRCSNCKSNNKITSKFCGSCGSEYREQDSDALLSERNYDENTPHSTQEARDLNKPAEKTDPKKRPGLRRAGIFGLISAGFAAFLSLFSANIEVTVLNKGWTTECSISEYKQVAEEGWQLPTGAVSVNSYRTIHHYDNIVMGYQTRTRTVKVPTGTEDYVCGKRDLGNGYFEDRMCSRTIYDNQQETYQQPIYQQVPVYATKYRYKVWRWLLVENLKQEGLNSKPKWNTKNYLQNTQKYKVQYLDSTCYIEINDHKNEKHKEYIGWKKWYDIEKGQNIKAHKYMFYGGYKGLAE